MSLRSAHAKLARANLHARYTKRAAHRFFKADAEPSVRLEIEGDQQPTPGELFTCLVVVNGDGRDFPATFAARFGDAIQNYRHALDHVAWQLVKHGNIPNPANPYGVQFPIYNSRKAFREKLASRLPGVASGPLKFIEARHAYRGGKATNDTLTTLATLSNDDKHRALHVVGAVVAAVGGPVAFINCELVSHESPPVPPAFKDGAEVARLTLRCIRPNAEMNMRFDYARFVILEDGRAVNTVLDQIRDEVAGIVSAPEITSAVS